MTDSYAIVLDSTSDIPEELEKKYSIPIVPAHVIIGGKDYLDRVGISREQIFYDLLNSDEKITTTQPSPIDFFNTFTETLKEYDKILYLGVSSGLSATFQNATIAAKKFEKGKIIPIDTLSVSLGITLMAQHAMLCRENGVELDSVIEQINEMITKTRIYILVQELKYLQRGGRIGKAKHVIGSLLNLKPILHFVDGEIDALMNVRGTEAGYEAMIELVTKDSKSYSNFAFSGAYGLENKTFEGISNSLRDKFNPLNYHYHPIGPAVACHVGPNVEAFITTQIPEDSVNLYK